MSGLGDAIGDQLPSDHARQVHSSYYIDVVAERAPDTSLVLDLGCGLGRSRKTFTRALPAATWVGVDIVDSPEVAARSNPVPNLVSYDGTRLPFADGSFDCVYSNQVLEHVRHPDTVIEETLRVLRPGGYFIGSTSHLEPFHSYSYWNFTPWGLTVMLQDAGFRVHELRPGIDGRTLIERVYRNFPPEMSRYFTETSPLNAEIDATTTWSWRRTKRLNARKLQLCGHFSWLATRPRR